MQNGSSLPMGFAEVREALEADRVNHLIPISSYALLQIFSQRVPWYTRKARLDRTLVDECKSQVKNCFEGKQKDGYEGSAGEGQCCIPGSECEVGELQGYREGQRTDE